MSEEQTWVFHAGLDRWGQVSETSLADWADLGWEHKPEGPPSGDETRFSPEEIAERAAELGAAPAPEAAEVSIETPEPEASTAPASLNQDSGTPQED